MQQAINATSSEELREFMLVIRRALLLIVAYIDRRYGPERLSN